jgi:hypothetical protein
VWSPLLANSFAEPLFPLLTVESQLTAAGPGHFFMLHADAGPENTRTLSCIYYFHREPRGFAGGELRLYDSMEQGGDRRAAETFEAIEPVSRHGPPAGVVITSILGRDPKLPIRLPLIPWVRPAI